MGLPDATVLVLQGFIFVILLASETLYGRFPIFQPAAGGGAHVTHAPLLTVLISLLGGAIRVSTPFMFVALGECLTEKSGPHQPRPRGHARAGRHARLCHGVSDGLAVARRAGRAASPARMLGAIHGYICKLPKVNDIAVGIAMMSFGIGLAFFFGKPFIQPQAAHLPSIPLGDWTGMPELAEALRVNPLFFVGILAALDDGLGLRQHALGPRSCA